MKSMSYFRIAALGAVLCAAPSATASAQTSAGAGPGPGYVNPCSGVRIWDYEHIESQGFPWFTTPHAHATSTVGAAIDDNVRWSWQKQEWLYKFSHGEPWTWEDYQKKYPPGVRMDGSWYQFLAFDFRLGELCQQAKRDGYTSLKLACEADSLKGPPRHIVEHPAWGVTTQYDEDTHWTRAECFVAAYRSGDRDVNDDSLDSARKHRWGPVVNNDGAYWAEFHDDALGDTDYREKLYATLLRDAINSSALEHREKSLPAGTGGEGKPVNACVPKSAMPLDASQLPPKLPLDLVK